MRKDYIPTYLIFKFIPVLFFVFVFAGCPYGSMVPLTETGAEIPEEFFGEWLDVSANNSESSTRYVISKSPGNKLEILEYVSSESEPNLYKGHLSILEDVMFVNLKDDYSTSFYIYRIDKDGSDLAIKEVTSNVTKEFETSAELEKYFREYMHLDFFYSVNNQKRFVRIE